MILALIVAAIVWSMLSPDRVASPVRAAGVAAARGAGQSGRAAAAARWAAGAPGRAARRAERSKTWQGRMLNAAGTALVGLGRILGGTSTTAGAAAAGAASAGRQGWTGARQVHRERRQEARTHPSSRAATAGGWRQRLRDAVLGTACARCGHRSATVFIDNGQAHCPQCHADVTPEPIAAPEAGADARPATGQDPDTKSQPGPDGGGAGSAADEPELTAQEKAVAELRGAEWDAWRAESDWRRNEDNAPEAPSGPVPPADAPAVVLARYQARQARYEAALATWRAERERLRAASDAAEAKAAALRAQAEPGAGIHAPDVEALLAGLANASPEQAAQLVAAASDDVVAAAVAQQEASQNSLPTGEGSTTDSTTNERENDMAGTTLDIPNADALLVVARAFSAAAEAASQLQAIAMNAQNLPDALGYGPGTPVLRVVMALAELAPDPKQLGEFADTLPLLEKELLAQLNRNEVITTDGLTGDAQAHTTS